MPIECVLSNLESDVRCAVCGQGFLLFADRFFQQHRDRFRHLVQAVLRLQHDTGDHPAFRFAVPIPAELMEALQTPLFV